MEYLLYLPGLFLKTKIIFCNFAIAILLHSTLRLPTILGAFNKIFKPSRLQSDALM